MFLNAAANHHCLSSSVITAIVETAMPRDENDPIQHIIALRVYFRGAATLAMSMPDVLRRGVMGPMMLPTTVKWDYDADLRK